MITLLYLSSGFAGAQSGQTGFIPDPPVTHRPVVYRQTFLGCPPIPYPNVDGISSWNLIDGNEVHLFIVFLAAPCGVPPPGPTVDFNFGFLPAGDYTLFQYRVNTSVTFPVDPAEFDPLFEQSFTVVQGGPPPPQGGSTAVPGLTGWGMVLLTFLIACLAVWRFSAARA